MQATEALRQHCAAELAAVRAHVHAPANGEPVDASPGSSAFRLVLADGLLARLNWRDMGACKLAWADGVVGAAPAGVVPELLPPADDGAGATQGGIFIGVPFPPPSLVVSIFVILNQLLLIIPAAMLLAPRQRMSLPALLPAADNGCPTTA